MRCNIYMYCDKWYCIVCLNYVVWRLVSVNLRHERTIYIYVWVCVCVCKMRFVVDVAIEDFNWYVMIMIIMMILIWDDSVNKDHVNMNCCYCWWICEYELRLLLLLIISLRRDDIYVENNMEREYWSMLEMHWHVHVGYVRGGRSALTFQGLWHMLLATFIRWMLYMIVGGTVHWPSRVFGTSFWPRSYIVWSVCHGG